MRDLPDTAPTAWDDLEHLTDDVLRRTVSFPANRSAVTVLDLPGSFLKLKDAHIDAFQNIERLEAGDDDRDAVARRDRLVFLVPMTVQTWPAARKPCTRLVGASSSAHIAGGTSTCETSIEKFRIPSRWAR